MNRTDLAYRKTAVEGASGFGLLIALYDTLAGNLRRAAAAQLENDIERRCHEVNHALAVIGFLEDLVTRGPGGDLADNLVAFYAALRSNLIEAQAKQSAAMMEEEMIKVLKLRESWQRADVGTDSPSPEILPPVGSKGPSRYPLTWLRKAAGNWSA